MIKRIAGTGACPSECPAIRAERLLPERRIEIHVPARALAVASSRRLRLIALFALLAGAVAAGYIGLDDIAYQNRLRARQAETLRTRAANAELRAYAVRLRQQLVWTARQLAVAQAQIAERQAEADAMRTSLSAAQQQLRRLQTVQQTAARAAGPQPQAAPASGQQAAQIARLAEALVAAERQQQAAAAQRTILMRRLAQAESDVQRTEGRAGQLQLALNQLTAKLGAIAQQSAAPPAGSAEPGILGKVERKLAAAGIDVERFFASFGIRRGVGGPFIPARDAPSLAQLAVQQAAVTAMLKTLPVAAPLLHYRETSSFGIRHNPFTGRGEEFHPGIDLAAPYGAPIYATAPGIVTFAGWIRGYGKIVRIDHGHGVSTGYGHLHAFTVVVGETVAAGTQIGYEGSTGRSTGPHVIYEVRLDGEPVNPAPFLALGQEIAPTASAVIPVAAH